MKEIIKYHTKIFTDLHSQIINSTHYQKNGNYNCITVGFEQNPIAYFAFEKQLDGFCIIAFKLTTDDIIIGKLTERIIQIAVIAKKNISFFDSVLYKVFVKYGEIKKEGSNFILPIAGLIHNNIKRFIDIGLLPTGKNNMITDVPGVTVGHATINSPEEIKTGITAVLPHRGNLFKEKVIAASYVFNGFGKTVGLIQVNELGTIETPIILTNTLSIGVVTDGLIAYMLEQTAEIGDETGTVNPLVLECNDGYLNNIRNIALKKEDVYKAIKSADTIFAQGSIGAGTGMRCLGFKGGIGSASRILKIKNETYTLGVLVNSNFQGNSSSELIIKGRHLGKLINKKPSNDHIQGSIVVIIATDLPLSSLQLKRIAKRAEIGIGNTGGYAASGSGDIIIAFSVANKIVHFPSEPYLSGKILHNSYLNCV